MTVSRSLGEFHEELRKSAATALALRLWDIPCEDSEEDDSSGSSTEAGPSIHQDPMEFLRKHYRLIIKRESY